MNWNKFTEVMPEHDKQILWRSTRFDSTGSQYLYSVMKYHDSKWKSGDWKDSKSFTEDSLKKDWIIGTDKGSPYGFKDYRWIYLPHKAE